MENSNLDGVKPLPPNKPNTIFVVIVTIVITAIIVSGGMLVWQRTMNLFPKPDAMVSPLAFTSVLPTAIPSSQPIQSLTSYKQLGLGIPYLSFEVPTGWSVTENPESVGTKALPDFPMLSIGETDVAYGDTNWSQVDFFYVQNDIVDQLVKEHEANDSTATLTKETIAGLPTTVFTEPLDGDQVTKAGTGGKDYYIKLPVADGGSKTLYIRKQALGDAEFENGFTHLLQSLKIGQ